MSLLRESLRRGSTPFFRPTWAEISLKAFQANAAFLSRRAGTARLLAVLKADGYGHGAGPLAQALERRPPPRFWGFGVSSVEEGIALRRAGVKGRVLVLGSLFPFDSFAPALAHRLTPTISSWASARALARAARGRGSIAVHVKVDTGMGRIGLTPATALETVPRIAAVPGLALEGVYTHLARGEDPRAVREQLRPFGTLVRSLRARGLSFLAHAANSAGMLCAPEGRLDLVRPGLALYGVPPAASEGKGLSPVLAWKTRVVFLKTVPKGTPVSYGSAWRAPRRSRLATLPVGYADGYRRGMSGKAQVLIKGRRRPVVGRITMDQIVVDVTGLPGVDVGEEAVLLGAQGRERVTADEMASWAGTVSYEVLCGISGRVPRVLVP